MIILIFHFWNLSQADERLSGFVDHLTRVERFHQQREAGRSEVKKNRLQWEEQKRQSLEQHLQQRQKLGRVTDDTSKYYREDQELRQKRREQYELNRQKFAGQQRAKRKARSQFEDIDEFGLYTTRPRVEASKRTLLGRPSSGRSSGAGSSFGGGGYAPPTPVPPPPPPPSSGGTFSPPELSGSDGAPPPTNSEISDSPEFYEPTMPLDEGGMIEDEIPPPIFEDEQF